MFLRGYFGNSRSAHISKIGVGQDRSYICSNVVPTCWTLSRSAAAGGSPVRVVEVAPSGRRRRQLGALHPGTSRSSGKSCSSSSGDRGTGWGRDDRRGRRDRGAPAAHNPFLFVRTAGRGGRERSFEELAPGRRQSRRKNLSLLFRTG